MGIGALDAVGYQPYIYNTNSVSAVSMNRIAAIPEDVTNQKLDYSGLVDSENVNPLGRGQSANFMDILAAQMSMGRNHASLIMKNNPFNTIEEQQNDSQDSALDTDAEQEMNDVFQDMTQDNRMRNTASDLSSAEMTGVTVNTGKNTGVDTDMNTGMGSSLYQMNHAIAAYSMSMGIA